MTNSNFAILAPVPLHHLVSGLDVLKSLPYIAYGSMKYELFLDVDKLRGSQPVPMLIYPSHETDAVTLTYQVSWVGMYLGFVRGEAMKKDDVEFRPESCRHNKGDDSSTWALYWHIRDLRQLPPAEHIPISRLDTLKGYWRKNYPPRGPEIVARPEWV